MTSERRPQRFPDRAGSRRLLDARRAATLADRTAFLWLAAEELQAATDGAFRNNLTLPEERTGGAMPDHPPEAEYLYCRVALQDGLHALHERAMTEVEADEANLDLIAAEPAWARVSRADDDYFATFYATPLTTIAAEALARAIGVGAAPCETLAALEVRYLPIFLAMIRSAHAIGRQVRLDMREA